MGTVTGNADEVSENFAALSIGCDEGGPVEVNLLESIKRIASSRGLRPARASPSADFEVAAQV